MATLTEDFADSTYVTPITGSWVFNASGGRTNGRLTAVSINFTTGYTISTVTVPATATSVRFWYNIPVSGASIEVFDPSENSLAALSFTSGFVQTAAINISGLASFDLFAYSSSATTTTVSIDDMVFTLPDAGAIGWGAVPIR